MNSVDKWLDQIDDYEDTIFAILGFVNFYRFDDATRKMRDDVVVFQGRWLTPSPGKALTPEGNEVAFVQPDFGILYEPNRGVLGEAKKSFPQDRTLWRDDFRQLMGYDDDLTGWPCQGESVAQHDVVLLTHQTRVVAVVDYCREKMATGQVRFERPFAIVSFIRSDERQPYFHFERRLGRLSDTALDDRLRGGVPVPMKPLLSLYSTVKLYDSEPPLPYMMWMIWEHVVAPRAADQPRFPGLRKRQKLEVTLEVVEIVEQLSEGFSFRLLLPQLTERQPMVPAKAWCVRACEALVEADLAKWTDRQSKEKVVVSFRRFDDVLTEMASICAKKESLVAPQTPLALFDAEPPAGRQPTSTDSG